jgi:acetylornithine deacetylase/succinyl-diaminopimelate desuccinylase-like protein
MTDWTPPHVLEIAQKLVRFETVNPPGNEKACIQYIAHLLHEAGLETTIFEPQPGRQSLLCWLKGDGSAPGFLMQGHVDVVGVTGQKWSRPPFAGDVAEGFLWGRGTLDMKGAVAMMLSAFLRAEHDETPLAGDVALLILADEEAGSPLGAKWITENHADLFEGVKYGIGEFGGYTQVIGGKRFYPIMVDEKVGCGTRVLIRGRAGHGSVPVRGNDSAMAKLGHTLTLIDTVPTPVHITPVARMQIEAIAAGLDGDLQQRYLDLLDPAKTDAVLATLGADGEALYPIFHNTVSPTVVAASDKRNVIPALVDLTLDCRLLPGMTQAQWWEELRAIIGREHELDLLFHVPREAHAPDMALWPLLTSILREQDPIGVPVPMLFPGGTDGRFFTRLGVQTYGFLPTPMPAGMTAVQMIHKEDERIAVDALGFGTNAIHTLLKRYGRS